VHRDPNINCPLEDAVIFHSDIRVYCPDTKWLLLHSEFRKFSVFWWARALSSQKKTWSALLDSCTVFN